MHFILIVGLLVRLIYIVKPEGLWNDEYVSWMIANTPFCQGFLDEILKQCHMPLYYLYLKPFSFFSDTIMRLSSVIPGVISIYAMYLTGKEYSKRNGIISAFITSILSFLIYYSQEVRFYSLLFMLSAFLLLFTIKLTKNQTKTNFIYFNLLSILIIFTHVLGIIFVALNYLYVIYKNKKTAMLEGKRKLYCVAGVIIISCLLIPISINILRQLPSSQWWNEFSYTNILFLFSDFFSPILTNSISAPPVFFYNSEFVIWMTVPMIIAGILIITGARFNKGICAVSILTIAALSILAFTGKIVFVSKYAIEILPILIILMVCGIEKMKQLGMFLLIIFSLFHIVSFFSPFHVTKIYRAEGNRIVGEIINYRKPQNVIFTYYSPERFKRYTDLKNINTFEISKSNRFDYTDSAAKILNEIPAGETVSIVFLNTVSFYPESYLIEHKQNLPEMFVTFSHIKNTLIKEIADKEFKLLYDDTVGAWRVITIKIHN